MQGGSDTHRDGAAALCIGGVRRAGDRAILVECASWREALRLARELLRQPLSGQEDVVQGETTVFAAFDDARSARAARSLLREWTAADPAPGTAREVRIDVVYDGPDLDTVGELTGLGRAGVARLHARPGGPSPSWVSRLGSPTSSHRTTSCASHAAGSPGLVFQQARWRSAAPIRRCIRASRPAGGSSSGDPRPSCGTRTTIRPRLSPPVTRSDSRPCGRRSRLSHPRPLSRRRQPILRARA